MPNQKVHARIKKMRANSKKYRYPLKIALIYAFAGAAWILFSDVLLFMLVKKPMELARLETIKGWTFIALTAVLLYLAISKMMSSIMNRDERLRKNEKFLGDILDSFEDGIIILDRQMDVIRANPAMERLFPEHMPLKGKKCWDTYCPDGKLCQACPARQAMETGKQTRRELQLSIKGEKRWIDLYSYPLRDSGTGEITGAIQYLKDITDCRSAQDSLRESEEKYRAIFNAANDAVLITDETGRILEVNSKTEELAGKSVKELVGHFHSILHPPDEAVRYGRILASAIEEKKPVSGDIFVMKTDGSMVPIEFSASRAEFGGKPIIVIIIRDISHRRKAEERIQQQLDMLSALYSGAQKLSESLDLASLANSVVSSSVASFHANFAWISIAEPGGKLRLLALYPDIPEFKRLVTLRWDDSPAGRAQTGRAIKTGLPVITEDLKKEESFAPWLESALSEGLRTGASFPLMSREKTLGALTLYSGQPGFFTRERVRFFQAYAHQAAAALENARLYEETGHRLERLNALCSIDTAITQSMDLRVIFDIILDRVITQLKVDAADILLMDANTLTFHYAAGRGFRTRGMEETSQRLGEGGAGHAALERRTIGIENIAETRDDRSEAFAREGFVSYFASPLITKGQILGVLELFHRTPLKTDREWMDFLGVMASQAAIAIENATLFSDLQRSNTELALAYDTTLEGWSRALDLRDRETEGHTSRVTGLTLRLARSMGMGNASLIHIRRGSLLHDIGKMGIPDSILLKPGPLTSEERDIMHRHPIYALDLLQPIAYLRPALSVPYLHHERWDGTGYPKGLKGAQIPLAARIFSVVDVWDALRSERPYRPPWPKERVLEHMKDRAGTHFDPRVVDKFIELVGSESGEH